MERVAIKMRKKKRRRRRKRIEGEEKNRRKRSEAVWLYGRYGTVRFRTVSYQTGLEWDGKGTSTGTHPCDSSELDKLVQHSPFLRY